ncbi:hypothetical protein EHO61_03745 [Leptospira fluminis]|uniref:Lipoprotein LipL46 n=1 Tax=Leptospira fluminis TaxID=2484979 RepID=A0A4R9GTN1_9LEPT|nr:hypothetical protein [Leptospira fluminis]TGK20980.1 hypothetical protein EHO61_03745 [Leptospira fluminis]
MLRNTGYKLLLTIILFFHFGCTSGTIRGSEKDGYIEVEVVASNREDAERVAKSEMIGKILGEFVQTSSLIVDSGSKGYFAESSREGLIRSFSVISTKESSEGIRLKASGYVSKNLLGDALEEQYKLIGKPRILVLISEKIGPQFFPAGKTGIETKFISRFSGFEFLDQAKSTRISSEKLETKNSEPGSKVASDVLEAAIKEDCELVLLGSFESRLGDKIVEGSEMRGTFASLNYKLIETRTGQILAADTVRGGRPAIDLNFGSEKAKDQILSELSFSLKNRLADRWKRGYTIRLTIRGMNYDTYADLGVAASIRSIRGINSVTERGKDGSGDILLDIEALYNAGRLYGFLREYKDTLGFSFQNKEISGNSILIRAEPVSLEKK